METIKIKCKRCDGTGLRKGFWNESLRMFVPGQVKTVAYPCDSCRESGCIVIHYETFEKRTRLKGVRVVRDCDSSKPDLTPKEFYENPVLLRNIAQCKRCGNVIESINRHDFVTCKCGKVSVDGGTDYLKRSGNLSDIEELSEYA